LHKSQELQISSDRKPLGLYNPLAHDGGLPKRASMNERNARTFGETTFLGGKTARIARRAPGAISKPAHLIRPSVIARFRPKAVACCYTGTVQ
jgi:hypothetical protein